MLKNGRFHTASPTPKKAQIGTRYWFIALFPVVCYLTGGASFPYLGFIMQIHTPKKHFGAQCKESTESCGTIYLDLHRMDTLVTIR